VFEITHDMLRPGRMRIAHRDPAALAAIPDAVAQAVAPPGTICSLWCLHHAEQDGVAHTAYPNERMELGPHAQAEVLTMARPHQVRVVWTDRYHLLATNAPASAATRVLGLYVGGSKGDAVLVLHHPSTSAQVIAGIRTLPETHGRSWDQPPLVDAALFMVRADRTQQDAVEAFASPSFVQPVNAALAQLGQFF
jgi:hypothetical protein